MPIFAKFSSFPTPHSYFFFGTFVYMAEHLKPNKSAWYITFQIHSWILYSRHEKLHCTNIKNAICPDAARIAKRGRRNYLSEWFDCFQIWIGLFAHGHLRRFWVFRVGKPLEMTMCKHDRSHQVDKTCFNFKNVMFYFCYLVGVAGLALLLRLIG